MFGSFRLTAASNCQSRTFTAAVPKHLQHRSLNFIIEIVIRRETNTRKDQFLDFRQVFLYHFDTLELCFTVQDTWQEY